MVTPTYAIYLPETNTFGIVYFFAGRECASSRQSSDSFILAAKNYWAKSQLDSVLNLLLYLTEIRGRYYHKSRCQENTCIEQ